MALWKRGRIWWSFVYLDGVRHAKSTGTANRRLAEKIDQNFRDELNLKRHRTQQPVPEMSFGELAARFIADGVAKPWHLDRLKVLLPYFTDIQIGHINRAMARDYRRYRHEQKKCLTETTVNRDMQALRRMLFWAVEEGLLLSNPLKGVPLTRIPRKPRKVMSVAEEVQLLDAASPHLRSIIIAALDTGMRRGELLGQRWEHVDLSRGLLQVSKSKTPGGEAREIPLAERLQKLLAQHQRPNGLVFTFNGRPVRAIKTAWKATIRRAGIRYYRFHDLRHTFNTRLMEAGVIQDIRMALMGHSRGNEVHSIYTHVELPAKREAIGKLEEWVTKQHLLHQQQGGQSDSTKDGRAFGQATNWSDGTEAVEKENPGGSRPRPN